MRASASVRNLPPLTNVACAIHAQRFTAVVEHCRKFIVIHQFNNEPLRMLCTFLASGYRATDSFIASTLQKHLFREMRLYDTAVHNKESLKWNAVSRRWGMNKAGEVDEGVEDEPNLEGAESDDKTSAPQLPAKNNPTIFALYGHICLAGKSYQSAICVFLLLILNLHAVELRFQSIFSTHTTTVQMTP